MCTLAVLACAALVPATAEFDAVPAVPSGPTSPVKPFAAVLLGDPEVEIRADAAEEDVLDGLALQ